MRKVPVILMTAALALASARAETDTVNIGKVPYKPVKVTGFTGGKVTFVMGTNTVTRPLDDIASITLGDRAAFSQAEELRTTDPAKALGLYDRANREAVEVWERRLISYRVLECFGLMGQTNRWVREWTSMLASGEVAAAKLRPAKTGDEAQLRGAIEHLEVALKQRVGDNAKIAIRDVLALLRANLPSARAPVNEGQQMPSVQEKPGPEEKLDAGTVRAPMAVQITGQSTGKLLSFEAMIKSGEAERAIRDIDEFLEKEANSTELPRAMFLAGIARLKVVEKTRSRRLLAEAAVMFMKVAVFCSNSPDAPEALYRAGEGSELLGDGAGAKAVYAALRLHYPKSNFAAHAAERLKVLQAEEAKRETEGKAAVKADK